MSVSRAYRIVWLLAMPVLCLYTIWRALQDGGWCYFKQRFGLGYPLLERPVWIHCASVGEVKAALPLLPFILQHTTCPLLVTTNTPTGKAVLRQYLSARVRHVYLPLDFVCAVRAFMGRLRPQVGFVMETELWPHLFQGCYYAGVAVVIVNGRISQRTLQAQHWLKAAYRFCLQYAFVLARSEQDQARFFALGAPAERVRVVGNIKFAMLNQQADRLEDLLPRRFVLAASTHDDEEYRLASVWVGLNVQDTLLVIAPRHPDRTPAILRQLAPLALNIAVRSRGEDVREDTQVYLADTLGEMGHFFAHAQWVFMGGSLVARGGQNILEPAYFAKAIVVGPHMENFADEVQLLKAHEAIVEVCDDQALSEVFKDFFARPEQLDRLGQNARHLIDTHRDVLQRYFSALESFLPNG